MGCRRFDSHQRQKVDKRALSKNRTHAKIEILFMYTVSTLCCAFVLCATESAIRIMKNNANNFAFGGTCKFSRFDPDNLIKTSLLQRGCIHLAISLIKTS